MFAAGKDDFGGIHNVKDFIDTGDSPPDRLSRQRVTQFQRESARREIEEMLDSDVIKPFNSPWTTGSDRKEKRWDNDILHRLSKFKPSHER